jgi:hypothetical protein
MRWYAAIVPFLLLSSTAYAQQSKNGAYDCVMEWSGAANITQQLNCGRAAASIQTRWNLNSL